MHEFEQRRQHAWNKLLWHVPETLRRRRFLDIGCGMGNGIVAALQHGATLAVGLDRAFDEFAHILPASDFPAVCRSYAVDPAQALMIEGDIFQYTFAPDSFDYALMLDSAEHVPDPGAFFRWAARALRPGGCFVVDTCPLYYSVAGAHLFDNFPPEEYPWVHLRKDFTDFLNSPCVTDWTRQRFAELNRATHDDIRKAFTGAGFEITFEHRSEPNSYHLSLITTHSPSRECRST